MSKTISSKIIATTEDTEDPVVQINLGQSKAQVIIDTQDECLNVWEVESAEEGDMKRMIDWIVDRTGYDWVQFIAPLGDQEKDIADTIVDEVGLPEDIKYENDPNNRNLKEVLDGFQEVTEEHEGKEVPLLVGFWTPEE